MQIGAVGFSSFSPYIYNTNALSANSLSPVAPISQDFSSAKTDFSGLTEDENNLGINPLRRGQTADFVDILEMQMHSSKIRASQVMEPEEETRAVEDVLIDNTAEDNLYLMRRASQAYMEA